MDLSFWSVTLIVLAIIWIRYGFFVALFGLAVVSMACLVFWSAYYLFPILLLIIVAYLFFAKTAVGRTIWQRVFQ
ncbi:hypothetical protein A3A38_02485 [Candidatus Kaiserbacteria bacterium RIFCSPLOWO2_01_FULL_53_17]|uniref:Uncharacterized protein n=1 Tax=Candidatus Kaiserbacteria bacterium RIFCSPLOWO2_01_FULL_53_17 TaxID=1798511 RepID=A0A1F6EFQ6_9BACT|nr:MAG: hypothetical protein A3A38_02485 [Candidatus Kaiserbacteria bacterium RIFCSPLOWO2_01_FULL_53_17]